MEPHEMQGTTHDSADWHIEADGFVVNLNDQPLYDIPEGEPDDSYGDLYEQTEGFTVPYGSGRDEIDDRERE